MQLYMNISFQSYLGSIPKCLFPHRNGSIQMSTRFHPTKPRNVPIQYFPGSSRLWWFRFKIQRMSPRRRFQGNAPLHESPVSYPHKKFLVGKMILLALTLSFRRIQENMGIKYKPWNWW